MGKGIKKQNEKHKKLYTMRLDEAANAVLNDLKANYGASKIFVVNYMFKKLPVIDYADYFSNYNKIVKKNNQKPPVYISTVMLDNANLERLKAEVVNAENYSIINKFKMPKEPSLLNYFIVKYAKIENIDFL